MSPDYNPEQNDVRGEESMSKTTRRGALAALGLGGLAALGGGSASAQSVGGSDADSASEFLSRLYAGAEEDIPEPVNGRSRFWHVTSGGTQYNEGDLLIEGSESWSPINLGVESLDADSVNTDELNNTVQVSPDQDLQEVVDANGSNTTYVLESGVWDKPGEVHLDKSGLANVSIIGQHGSTIIQGDENNRDISISDSENIHIEGLIFDGPGVGNSSHTAMDIYNTTRVTIAHNQFLDIGHDGIRPADGTTDAVVAFNYFNGVGDDGINPGGPVGEQRPTFRTYLIGNTVKNAVNDGIHISVGSNQTLSVGNQIESCGVGFGFNGAEDFHAITGNHIIGCETGIGDTAGTYVSGRVRVSDNTIWNHDLTGIFVPTAGTTEWTVTNNYVAGGEIGIKTQGNAVVEGNYIVGASEYEELSGGENRGIDLTNDRSHPTVVSDNIITGTWSNSIWCTGENKILSANHCDTDIKEDQDFNDSDWNIFVANHTRGSLDVGGENSQSVANIERP